MTRLAALTTGPGFLAGDFQGTVHSVFPHAVIIAPDGGRLLTVVPRAAGALPAGVTVDADADFSFDGSAARGEAAAARSGVLRIGSRGLAVDLRPATAWRSGLADLRLDMAEAAARRAALSYLRLTWRVTTKHEALIDGPAAHLNRNGIEGSDAGPALRSRSARRRRWRSHVRIVSGPASGDDGTMFTL